MRNKLTGVFTESHGMSYTYEYNIWGNMLYRCRTDTSALFGEYGGRGIKVCDRWLKFENFIADMGLRPSLKHSLDRIDPDGDYSPKNCRWATSKTQARNRRNSVKIEYLGEKLQIDDFCDKYQLNAMLVKTRLRRGWSVERIVSTPPRRYQIVNN